MRPVNEYNITDKVKQANQELFETPHPGSPDSLEATCANQQRVTFRQILVDYEPEYSSSEEEEESQSTEHAHVDKIGEKLSETNDIHQIEEEITTEIQEGASVMDEIQEDIEEELVDDESNNNNINEITPKESENINLRKLYEEQSTTESKDCDSIIEVMSTLTINSENVNLTGTATVTAKFSTKPQDIRSSTKSTLNQKSDTQLNKNQKPSSKSNRTSSDNIKNLQFHLNFRQCCDYKLDEHENLPRYKGYYSQYGLSKREIENREKRLQSMRMRQFERKIKIMEENASKSEQNEEAFANWLKNKMRHPKNRSKNMFDYKGKKRKIKKEIQEIQIIES